LPPLPYYCNTVSNYGTIYNYIYEVKEIKEGRKEGKKKVRETGGVGCIERKVYSNPKTMADVDIVKYYAKLPAETAVGTEESSV